MGCMKHIPADIVMKYAEELLAANHGQPAFRLPADSGSHQCRVIEQWEGAQDGHETSI